MNIVQLLAGRDLARGNGGASQMANFSYLIADRASGECVLVDPAWDIQALLDLVARQTLRLTGAVATHGHWDHVGGRFAGQSIEGVARLAALAKVPVWVNELDVARVLSGTGIDDAFVRRVKDGDALRVGEGEIRFLHTPGHTPGSHCLLAAGAVLTGDTLFVSECGRVDLPGSDPDRMFASLARLAALPEQTVVYPGHDYGATPTSTIGAERQRNPCLQPATLEEWRAFLAEP